MPPKKGPSRNGVLALPARRAANDHLAPALVENDPAANVPAANGPKGNADHAARASKASVRWAVRWVLVLVAAPVVVLASVRWAPVLGAALRDVRCRALVLADAVPVGAVPVRVDRAPKGPNAVLVASGRWRQGVALAASAVPVPPRPSSSHRGGVDETPTGGPFLIAPTLG
jgi:hypothetical protein